MKKRYIPIVLLLVCTCVVALFGYMMPSNEEKIPLRVLLDNSAGKVVFDHSLHESFGFACVDCHHDMSQDASEEEIAQNAVACRSCHGANIESEKFVINHVDYFKDPMQCVTCHHLEYGKSDWGHDFHVENLALDCLFCHHDTDIEPEPQNCADCHFTGYTPEDDPMPSLKNAVHERCMSCHVDLYEAGLPACASCHTAVSSKEKLMADPNFTINLDQAKCISCHTEASANELVPSTMDAFHISCMTCHETFGAGPYTPEQCSQCHM